MPFEASQAIFRLLSSQKESKLCKTLLLYKSSTRLAFIPEGKLQLSKFGHEQKFFFKRVSLPPHIFYLLCSLLSASFAFLFPFFSFVGHLLGLLSVGKGFAKSSRIVNVFEGSTSGWWDKIFIGIFWSKLHGFLRLSLVCFAKSRSSGYGLKDLISLHKLVVKVA